MELLLKRCRRLGYLPQISPQRKTTFRTTVRAAKSEARGAKMAKASWMVSVSFFLSPPSLQSLMMDVHPKIQARAIISSQQSNNAAFKILSEVCSSRGVGSDCYARASPIHLIKPVSTVSFCTRRLTGYWVGPDFEDGWGFVEAFIYEIV
ncbi:hypothetical protein Nepgr_014998 [Nepenthes gracilis]|uniref:Uncharacterized protein n=1 Tax=Nepenthes gracilis TaxID=150966 RepID=A0AAD3SMB5_NEPGR|nr:hypothetical protein Nepgr_014998 [Nepenthes gracilis]